MVNETTTLSNSSPLDALIIVFNHDFPTKDAFSKEILSGMSARDRPYQQWLTENTPIRILVNPTVPQDIHNVLAMAHIHFRIILGGRFQIDKVEHAAFQGSQGIAGVVLAHWSSPRASAPAPEHAIPAPETPALVQCDKCGNTFPEGDLVKVGRHRVCRGCDRALDTDLMSRFRSSSRFH